MKPVRLRYQTLVFGDRDIHVCTLRDRRQYHDPEGAADDLGISSASWPIFGVVWPSGLALARFIDGYDTGTKRILEVGCGMAVPSLLLNAKGADITATDCHPEVELFLARNTAINNGARIAFERTAWADRNDRLGRFDLIIASDVLYEDQHAGQLADFIQLHAMPACEAIVVDPGRGRKNKLITALAQFAFSCTPQKLAAEDAPAREFAGHILKFERQAGSPGTGPPVSA